MPSNPSARIPRQVRLGPYVYKVETSRAMVEWAQKRESTLGSKCVLDGYISFRHERIVLNTADCNATSVKYSLAHEVVHGILDQLGYGKEWERMTGSEDYEEGFVSRFAVAWLDAMRNNPQLVAFMSEK